jgi:hypothetical protein
MKPDKNDRAARRARTHKVHEGEGAASGVLVGAAVGAVAGPPGVVAGAVIGGVAGALAAAGLDDAAQRRSERDRALDVEIGVIGGEIGAPNLKHPGPVGGATCSAASAGAGSSTGEQPARRLASVP